TQSLTLFVTRRPLQKQGVLWAVHKVALSLERQAEYLVRRQLRPFHLVRITAFRCSEGAVVSIDLIGPQSHPSMLTLAQTDFLGSCILVARTVAVFAYDWNNA